VKSGRAVHRCIRSACRSHLCVGLCIVVVAVVAAAADAVLVALEVHPATIAQGGKPHLKVTDRSPRNQTALRARRVIKQSLYFFALRANC